MSENCLSFKVRPAQHIMCSLLTVWYIVCDGDQPLFCKRACPPWVVGIVFMLVLFVSAWGYGILFVTAINLCSVRGLVGIMFKLVLFVSAWGYGILFCTRACWHPVYACSLFFSMGLWYIVCNSHQPVFSRRSCCPAIYTPFSLQEDINLYDSIGCGYSLWQ